MTHTPIFRQDALDRLKSPDKLNDPMHVVSPSGWLALVGCAIFIIASLVWAFTAHLPVKIDAYGVLQTSADGTLVGVAYTSILDAPKIEPGMATEMIMSHVRSEEHGYLLGHTTEVSQMPSHDVPPDIQKLIRVEPVRVLINPTNKWSGPEPKYALRAGLFFHALITTSYRRPIDYVLRN